MARLIDAYQAIDIIDEWLGSVGTVMVGKGLSSYGELIGCIEDAPTLTQPNEWVNVEERLPEEGESVLCIVNGKPRKNITLCEAYQLGVWCKEDGWLIDEYSEWRDVEVLWWMPLPDAPEGEE